MWLDSTWSELSLDSDSSSSDDSWSGSSLAIFDFSGSFSMLNWNRPFFPRLFFPRAEGFLSRWPFCSLPSPDDCRSGWSLSVFGFGLLILCRGGELSSWGVVRWFLLAASSASNDDSKSGWSLSVLDFGFLMLYRSGQLSSWGGLRWFVLERSSTSLDDFSSGWSLSGSDFGFFILCLGGQ